MSKLSCFFLMLLLWLQYSLWFGKNGIFDLLHISYTMQLYKCTYDLSQMRMRNNQLLSEIYDLNYGYGAIEERSRSILGMIKSDETFYRIKL